MGPGKYEISRDLVPSSKGRCSAFLAPATVIPKETYYEMVNNCKVLQPRYMKTADKKLLQTEIKNFRRRLQARNESSQTLLRVKDWQRPNDTYLFQNALAGNHRLYTPMTDYRRTEDPL